MLLLSLACAPASKDDTASPVERQCAVTPALPMGCGDLNCDGAPDLVFAQTEDATGAYVTPSSVWWGPDFAPAAALALPTLGAVDVAAADLDGDDWPDLVFANVSDGVERAVDSYLYWGGPEGYTADRRTELPTVGASDIEIVDVDGDGVLDLIFSNRYDGGSAASAESYAVDVWIYLGGPEGYAVERRLAVPGFGAAQTAARDLDGDGAVDLAVAAGTFWTDTSWVYEGGPAGWSVDTRRDLPTLAPEAVLARDLDADGWLDLVFANFYDALALDIDSTVWWGGPEGFDPTPTAFPTHGADDLHTADLDGDGCEELIVANAMEGSFAGLDFEVDSAAWTFVDRVPTQVGSYPTVSAAALAGGDLNGDGAIDLIFANRYNPAGESGGAASYVYWGPGHTERVELPVSGAAGVTFGGGEG